VTLQEACELAMAIHLNSAYQLLAVGRFMQPELIEDKTPWGLSVLRREDNCRLMLWSEADWKLEGRLPRPPQAPDTKRTAAVNVSASVTQDKQGLLF
jgi:hypothetical protein